MNINKYILTFGNKTFEEFPFNSVDALILSEFSYINIDLLLSDKEDGLYLKDINITSLIDDVFIGSVDAKPNKKMLINMMKSNRYKDILVKDTVRIFSSETINQFFVVSLYLPNGELFVSYRGTDITFTGWREDFLMAYQAKILSQEQALNYLNDVLFKTKNKFYIGGHSKGGNLAFYCALNLNKKYNDRLIKAYSFDGPGFKNGIVDFPNYIFAKDKLDKYRTYNNVIGGLYNNITNYKVVYSNGILLGGHDPFYWFIDKNGDFVYKKDVSKFSKTMLERFLAFEKTVSDDDKKLIGNVLFSSIFSGCNTIFDYAKHLGPNLLKIKSQLNEYSEEDRARLMANLKKLFKYLLQFDKIKKEELSQKALK